MANFSIQELMDVLQKSNVPLYDSEAMSQQSPFTTDPIRAEIENRYAGRFSDIDKEKTRKIQALAEVDSQINKLFGDPSSKFYLRNAGDRETIAGNVGTIRNADINLTKQSKQALEQEMEQNVSAAEGLFNDLVRSASLIEDDDFEKFVDNSALNQFFDETFDLQYGIMPSAVDVTQPFGNKNASLEKYSGGVNLGTDFRTTANTPLSVPPVGEWQVIFAAPGWNKGSGNLVKLRNTKTGEVIGFEHLNQIHVKQGQIIPGGSVIGLSGGGQSGAGRGNSTGAHSSIIYMDSNGKYGDIRKSPYARYLFG